MEIKNCLYFIIRNKLFCRRGVVADEVDPRNSKVDAGDEIVCRRGGVEDEADTRNSGVFDERV